jgi:hypothetical protein
MSNACSYYRQTVMNKRVGLRRHLALAVNRHIAAGELHSDSKQSTAKCLSLPEVLQAALKGGQLRFSGSYIP